MGSVREGERTEGEEREVNGLVELLHGSNLLELV